MRPLLALLSALMFSLPAEAQFATWVRKLLVGDTTAAPNCDTAFITGYRKNLNISAVTSYKLAAVDIADTAGHAVRFNTNNAALYGAAIDLKWLSLEATFSLPALDAADPKLGTTTSRGLGAGYTGRRLWIRAFWNRSTGFYPEQPAGIVQGWRPGDPYPTRTDLSTTTWMASANYALSRKRRFSQVAAISQMERQKRSAGTWVAGASFWHTRLVADSSLVPTTDSVAFLPAAHVQGARRMVIGATIGYTHTFVFWHKGFIHASVLTGAASRDQLLQLDGRNERIGSQGASSLTELKVGAGYNGDRWYTALTTAFYLNADDGKDDVSLGSLYGSVRFAVGMRFGRPNIRGMEKLGL
jgi:hypothetical protein